MQDHTSEDFTGLPKAFHPYVPFPFYEVQFPITDRIMIGILGQLLRQYRGLG